MSKYEVSGDAFFYALISMIFLVCIVGYSIKGEIASLQEKVSWTESQIIDLIKE